MKVKEFVEKIRSSNPEHGEPMEHAQRLLWQIEEVCAVKKWTIERYFEVNPAEWWHLQETAGLTEPTYKSRTGNHVRR